MLLVAASEDVEAGLRLNSAGAAPRRNCASRGLHVLGAIVSVVALAALVGVIVVASRAVPSTPFVTAFSASLPLSSSCASSTSITGGQAVSIAFNDGLAMPGGGTSAYVGAQTLNLAAAGVSMRRPIVLSLSPTFAACVWQNGSSGGTYVTLLTNGGADWVTGGSVTVSGPNSYISPLLIVEDAAVMDTSDNSVILVGRGSAVVATLTPTGVVFGTVANFTTSVSVDNHVVALAGGFAVSYYDTNSTGALLLFTAVGTITRFTITFTPAVAYGREHISHVLTRVSDAAYALAFPDDDASVASDDAEQNGFPLGIVIAVWSPAARSVTLYGRGSSSGASGMPRPWTQPYVRTHYFLAAAPVRSFTPTQGGTLVIAAADRTVGDAIRALTVEVYASYTAGTVSAINVEFSDLASVTASGATVGYRTLSLTPIVTSSASEMRFLLSHSDPSAAGAIAGSVFSVAFSDASVTVNTRGLLLSAALPEADPTDYAEMNWVSAAMLAPSRVMLITVASLSDMGVTLGNLTIVEHMRPAFGIATATATCASSAASISIASSGVVSNVAWLPGSAAASGGGSPGLVAYASTRGGLMSTISGVYTPPGSAPGAAGVTINVARDAVVGIVLDSATIALSPSTPLA